MNMAASSATASLGAVIARQNAVSAAIDSAIIAEQSASAAITAYIETSSTLTQTEVDMLTDIWRRFGLDTASPLVQGTDQIAFGPVIALSGSSDIVSTRSGATVPGGALATMILEIWQRLGLDPLNPMTASATQISAGTIVQAISGAGSTVTVQRA